MTTKAVQAATELEADGISAEVVDLRTLVPMDTQAILDSVRKTGHLVIAQEAIKRGGVGSDIAATVAEQAFDSLRAPIVRVAGVNTVIPFNLALEKSAVPQIADIVAGARSVLGTEARQPAEAASR
jgi:pyruvate dehydrogenase E1 component beta subunit